jgi:ATP-dependent DNA helicase RecG
MRMVRLLQGDVGSGKTAVAALAMANAIECGVQAALMAPTDILARQHAETLTPLFEAAGIHCVTLTGRDKGKERQVILEKIRSGEAQAIIGTHALFQDSIEMKALGLAIIDEQHRFGVQQRLKLSEKGEGVDILAMTATPIPRTLTLTLYGDMDVSRLDEKPPGRQKIDTRLMPQDRLGDLVSALGRQIEKGGRAYWVCPLVEIRSD